MHTFCHLTQLMMDIRDLSHRSRSELVADAARIDHHQQDEVNLI
jgi:hypothetical protein